jgi:hypothetical protein
VISPQVDFFFLFFLPTSVIARSENLVRRGLVWQLAASGQTRRTRRKALLELVGFLGVLQHEGVKVFLAPDLELDVLTLLVLLDARRCEVLAASRPDCCVICKSVSGMTLTGSIFPAADLNELLDIGHLLRHCGGWRESEESVVKASWWK